MLFCIFNYYIIQIGLGFLPRASGVLRFLIEADANKDGELSLEELKVFIDKASAAVARCHCITRRIALRTSCPELFRDFRERKFMLSLSRTPTNHRGRRIANMERDTPAWRSRIPSHHHRRGSLVKVFEV